MHHIIYYVIELWLATTTSDLEPKPRIFGSLAGGLAKRRDKISYVKLNIEFGPSFQYFPTINTPYHHFQQSNLHLLSLRITPGHSQSIATLSGIDDSSLEAV
jgi:hypothetical protein